MNKSELSAAIAAKAEVTKVAAEKVLKAFEDVVTEGLVNGDKIQLVGFLTFETKKRAARMGINPATKVAIKIPACTVASVKVGKKLKEAVAK